MCFVASLLKEEGYEGLEVLGREVAKRIGVMDEAIEPFEEILFGYRHANIIVPLTFFRSAAACLLSQRQSGAPAARNDVRGHLKRTAAGVTPRCSGLPKAAPPPSPRTVRGRLLRRVGSGLHWPRIRYSKCLDKVVSKAVIGALSEAPKKTRKPRGVLVVNGGSWINAMSDFVTSCQGFSEAFARSNCIYALPSPTHGNIRETDAIGDDRADILGVGIVEPANLTPNGCVEGRPRPHRGRCRPN